MANGLYVPRVGLPQSISPGPSQLRAVPDTSGISKVLSDVSLRLFEEHNEAMARDAVNSFRTVAREKNVELLSRKGKDADGTSAAYDEWYKASLDENMSKLGNPAQRDIFKQTADEMAASDKDQLALHEANEHMAFIESTFKGTVARWEGDILINPNDATLSSADADIALQLKKIYPGKDTTAEYARIRANNYITAFETISAKDPKAGAAFAERHKDKLGGAYNTIIKESKHKTDEQLSQDTADSIWDKNGDHKSRYAAALKIKDATIRKGVISILEARHADQENIKEEGRRASLNHSINQIRTSKTMEGAMKVARSVGGEDGLRLEAMVRARYAKDDAKDNKKIRLETPMYKNKAREEIDNGADPDDVVLKYGAHLTPEAQESIYKYAAAGGNIASVKDETVRKAFKLYSGGKDPNKEENAKLYDMVYEEVVNNLVPGKNMTSNEINNIVSEALIQGEVPGEWWRFGVDPDVRRIEAVNKGKGKEFFAEDERRIDGATQAEVYNALKTIMDHNKTAKLKVKESDENIMRVIKQQRAGR